MSTPVLESVAQNVLTTLQGITTLNGYNYTLTVERENKNRGNAVADKLAIIKQMSPSRVGEDGDSQGHVWWQQPFEVDCFVVEPEDSATPLDQISNQIRSDMEKALMVDYTRGGFAQDTRIDDPELFESANGDFTGVTVRFTVTYATLHGDPYQQ